MSAERDRLNRTADLNRRLENAAPCPKCEIWFVDYWAKVAEKQAAERERDAALARVGVLEAALRDIETGCNGRMGWLAGATRDDFHRLLGDIGSRAAAALAPRRERREGECEVCQGHEVIPGPECTGEHTEMVECPACAPAAPKEEAP